MLAKYGYWLVSEANVFLFCSCVLKASGFSFDVLGEPMTAHFGMPMSMPAHAQYSLSCSVEVGGMLDC